MHGLSAPDVFRILEEGEDQDPVHRALTLLAPALPERTQDELEALSIGERDRLLFALRERTLGTPIHGLAACPACDESLEFSVASDDLRVTPGSEEREAVHELVQQGLVLCFRLPNSEDLAAVAGIEDPELARRTLAERCIVEATRNGSSIEAGELSPAIITELAARMAECDPEAEILLQIRCPSCGEESQLLFDVGTFFWTELEAEAKELLREVHALARAYGWREADILRLSPWRRQLYLEMIGA